MSDAVVTRSRVVIQVDPGERLVFAQAGIVVELVSKSGRAARLCVTAPRDVVMTREGDGESEFRSKHAIVPVTQSRG